MKIKRTVALLLCLFTILSLAACGEAVSNDLSEPASLPVITEDSQNEAAQGETLPAPLETQPDKTESESATSAQITTETNETEAAIAESGEYTKKDDVALYIHTYGCLPANFITKKEAERLGWTGGSLEPYAPGKSIGGDRFGNYEGLLPDAPGRKYTECDIDTRGKSSRGAKRIVFSNDGLIYYTEDHYKSFTLLYGGDEG